MYFIPRDTGVGIVSVYFLFGFCQNLFRNRRKSSTLSYIVLSDRGTDIISKSFIKKLFIIIATTVVACCISASAGAQSISEMFETDARSKVGFGVRAGLNISDISMKAGNTKQDLKPQAGFHVGATVDIPITNGFYIQPGLAFSSKGARYVDKGDNWKEVESMFPVYLEIPVLASFRADVAENVNLQLNIGPYFDFGLGGNVSYKWKEGDESGEGESYPFFGKPDDSKYRAGMKRFDVGLSFGIGIELLEHYYAGIKYDVGLINMAMKDVYGDNYKAHNGTFAITFGYNF